MRDRSDLAWNSCGIILSSQWPLNLLWDMYAVTNWCHGDATCDVITSLLWGHILDWDFFHTYLNNVKKMLQFLREKKRINNITECNCNKLECRVFYHARKSYHRDSWHINYKKQSIPLYTYIFIPSMGLFSLGMGSNNDYITQCRYIWLHSLA